MKFLQKLFANHLPQSPLEDFGSRLSPESIRAALRTKGTDQDRIAWAIAMTVLFTANAFASGMQEQVASAPALGRKKRYRLPYDELFVEAAAFCHYVVRSGYPDEADDDDDDDDDELELDESDDIALGVQPISGAINQHAACTTAMHCSQTLIAKCLPEGQPRHFLVGRDLFYARGSGWGKKRNTTELFCSVILGILKDKVPNAGGIHMLGPDQHLSMVTAVYVPVYYETRVAGLVESTKALFEHSDEILRESRT